MTKLDLQLALNEETFAPFVLTTADGFEIAVGSWRDAFLGLSAVFVRDSSGLVHTIAFSAITRLSEKGDSLG